MIEARDFRIRDSLAFPRKKKAKENSQIKLPRTDGRRGKSRGSKTAGKKRNLLYTSVLITSAAGAGV